jgi:hypothetical protein
MIGVDRKRLSTIKNLILTELAAAVLLMPVLAPINAPV